jgi:uncharacterized membrane protein YkoI
MTTKLKVTLAAGAIAALAAGGAAIAAATGGGDDGSGKPITGTALDRASAVALAHTGGGRVTDTEVNDEEGFYEVEVVRTDGRQVDVHLDRHFNVLNEKGDGSGENDSNDD